MGEHQLSDRIAKDPTLLDDALLMHWMRHYGGESACALAVGYTGRSKECRERADALAAEYKRRRDAERADEEQAYQARQEHLRSLASED